MRFELTEDLPSDYNSLFERSRATAFQHPSWVRAFIRHLAPGRGARCLFATARKGDELIGTVALTLRRHSGLRLLEPFDLGVCDYVAPVVADGYEPADGLRRVLPPHDLMRVMNVRPEHAAFWSAFCDDTAVLTGFSAHAVALHGSFDEWRTASIDRSLASQTKRKARRWAREADVRCERVDVASVREAVAALAALRSGRFQNDPIQNEATCDFYAAVAEDAAFCEVWRLRADGQTAGLMLGVTHRGAFHYLQIGCDYETFGRHSPGQQFYERVIADWMDRGGTSFDFTIGDEPFKRQYGTVATPMSRIYAARTWPGRLGRLVLERRGKPA